MRIKEITIKIIKKKFLVCYNLFFSLFIPNFLFRFLKLKIKKIAFKGWFISLSIGSLLLNLLKLFVGPINPFINLFLLFFFSFHAHFFGLDFFLRYFIIIPFLKKYLPKRIFAELDETVDDFILLWQGCEKEVQKFKALKKVTFFNSVVFKCFIFLIFLRLIFFYNPLVYSFFNFIFAYTLIFNSQYSFLYFFNIIMIISRVCFTLSDKTYSEVCRGLYYNTQEDLNDPEVKIIPNKENATIISYWVLRLIDKEYLAIWNKSKKYQFSKFYYIYLGSLIEERFGVYDYEIKTRRKKSLEIKKKIKKVFNYSDKQLTI